jgi:UDP-N-acetylmuramate--alanine ligase
MNIYFIGICGIGMSGIAQAFRWLGHNAAGSDRQSDPRGINSGLINYFNKKGIKIFPQDGSFRESFHPEIIVYSSAVEKDNPDFAAAGNTRKIHRSEALALLLKELPNKTSIAVTGCSGKTTVSCWIAEALENLACDPVAVIGGKSIAFSKDGAPGNFRDGGGDFFVFEADESDKSLLNYSPDYVVILNTGTDHYPEDEQNEVFAKFAGMAKKAVITSSEIYEKISTQLPAKTHFVIFDDDTKRERHSDGKTADFRVTAYSMPKENKDGRAKVVIQTTKREIRISLPFPGFHNAMNSAAVLAALSALEIEGDIPSAIENFSGVHRRFQFLGNTKSNCPVFDDYAHNPDKISSCIVTAKEISNGRLFFVFQPHGYGPLGFMKEKLAENLKKVLHKNDVFIFLPVYYAGGTSSFSPKSEEAADEYRRRKIGNCIHCPDRSEAEKILSSANSKDCIIIAGARDESLAQWANTLVAPHIS